MNVLVEQYWARALNISGQYEAGEVNYADLTGLTEAYAASFIEHLNTLPEVERGAHSASLESRLASAIAQAPENDTASQALHELLMSIQRTPIY